MLSASSTSRAATSPASTGWNRNPAGAGITGSLASCLAVIKIASWNWVARKVVHGNPESATTRSAASLAAKYAYLANRVPQARNDMAPERPVDLGLRAPILQRYLQVAPGARAHIPVDRRASLAELAQIAPDYPVFRVHADAA